MPELPEVEVVATRLREHVLGAVIENAVALRASATKPQLPEVLQATVGRSITAVERRAKNILMHLSGGLTVRVHLRMTGHLYVTRQRPAATRLYFVLADGREIVMDDSRAFGRTTVHATEELAAVLGDLGLEPLGPEFTLPRFTALVRASRMPAKLFLLDQSKVAGLGNIWAAEALWAARIRPTRPVGRLTAPRVAALHAAIVTVLRRAVQSALAVAPEPGDFPEADLLAVEVYGRAGNPCRRCQRPIARLVQGGRSTYYCPGCQR